MYVAPKLIAYGDVTAMVQGCKGWGFENVLNYNDSTTTVWRYLRCSSSMMTCYWTSICTDGSYWPSDQCQTDSDCSGIIIV